jgi:NAD(P)H-dependent FMN reductase
MSLRIVVIFGSMRSDRLGIRAARFVVRRLEERGHQITLVDALQEQLPLLDRMYKEYPKGEAPPALERLASLYRSADAFVIVTGEYIHGLQPGLSNLLDHFLEEYFFRPSAIVSYSKGQFAGVRATVHLQAVLCELGMPSISSLFPIPRIGEAFAEDGTPKDPKIEQRFGRFAAEFEWYAGAMREARRAGVPY